MSAPGLAALSAHIDESLCIGCTKCIQACPVDAIVGAAQRMHTVVEARCTGCQLCLPPCPVECIVMQAPRPGVLPAPGSPEEQERLRQHQRDESARRARLARAEDPRERLRAAPAAQRLPSGERRRLIAEAVARSRARRASRA